MNELNVLLTRIAKYVLFLLSIVIFIAVGFEQLYFRGKLIRAHQGVVLSSWDNTNAPSKSRSIHIYRAAVELDNGEVVQVICESMCIEGKVVMVEQFKPLFGDYSNYYTSF